MEPLPDFLLPLEFLTRPFPREAVEAVVERRDESIPHLLNSNAWADANPDDAVVSDPAYLLHLFALYLLAQFRETRAYPLIVHLFRNPEYENLTGDVATESLPRILASVCGGDLAPIKGLIEDGGVDEWVRGAAMYSLAVLAENGQYPREDLSAYIGALFTGELKREPNHVWDSLVIVCVASRLTEHLDSIRQLYRDEIADETFISPEGVEKEIALPPGVNPHSQPLVNTGLIDSAVAELEDWDCFRPRTEEEKEKVFLEDEFLDSLLAGKRPCRRAPTFGKLRRWDATIPARAGADASSRSAAERQRRECAVNSAPPGRYLQPARLVSQWLARGEHVADASTSFLLRA